MNDNDVELLGQLVMKRILLRNIGDSIRLITDGIRNGYDECKSETWLSKFIGALETRIDEMTAIEEGEEWRAVEGANEENCTVTRKWLNFLKEQFSEEQREFTTLQQACDELTTRMAQLSRECIELAKKLGMNPV